MPPTRAGRATASANYTPDAPRAMRRAVGGHLTALIMWIAPAPRGYPPVRVDRRRSELRPVFDALDIYC